MLLAALDRALDRVAKFCVHHFKLRARPETFALVVRLRGLILGVARPGWRSTTSHLPGP
jgi:hypothetical protein